MRHFFTTLILAASLAIVGCGKDDDDRLSDDEIEGATTGTNLAPGGDNRCTAPSSLDAAKRELFRRAAEIRGSNASNYAVIAGFAVLNVDGAAPTAPASAADAVECRGRATLRLPPNLSVAGGRTTLTGTIGYSVGRASGGAPPVVTLIDDDALTIPLATLAQRRAARPSAPGPEPEPEPQPAPEREPEPDFQRPVPMPNSDPREATAVRPSFDCRQARTRGEQAVCSNPTLAGLDVAMADRYRAAIARAGPGEQRLLRETRDRFLGYRDRCGNDACIANTYRGRMREIDDIVSGRWQPPRR